MDAYVFGVHPKTDKTQSTLTRSSIQQCESAFSTQRFQLNKQKFFLNSVNTQGHTKYKYAEPQKWIHAQGKEKSLYIPSILEIPGLQFQTV